jgi:hypothetical protein
MTDIFVAPKKVKDKEENLPKKTAPKFSGEHDRIETYGSRDSKIGFFSSFHLYPRGISFKDQEENEEIILFLRRHFITNISWICIAFIIAVIPTVLFFYRNFFPIPPLPAIFNLFAFLFYFIVIGAYIYTNFISWYFNVSLVTPIRIIDIEFTDLIYHDMAVTKLNLIEDITYAQAGTLRSFFDYGDFYVQTAGSKERFSFLAIPQPEHVLDIVENLMGGDRHVR